MASWIARASGDIEDPDVIKSLFAELGHVLRKAEHGTGSSEFTSPHISAANFHEPKDAGSDSATGEPDPGGESWRPGEPQGGAAPAG